jgi:uncharacterized membrane protein YhaH (DUF805 family)
MEPFDKYFLDVLKNHYVDFGGRVRRETYWMFALFGLVISIVLTIIDAVLGIGFLGFIYSLGVLLPSLGLAVRRLHDTGKTGWWLLISLVPLIGLIVLIVFLATDSHDENSYGPNPKTSGA